MSGVLPVLFDCSQLKNLSSSVDEILQLLLIFRGFWSDFGINEFRELCEVTGINRIGLCSVSQSFGKVTCLSRIDNSDGNVGINEMADESTFVSPGGLDDQELKSGELLEMSDELIEPLSFICQSPFFRKWSNMNIEFVLGDINTYEYWRSNVSDRDGVDPVLQMRTRDGGSRSTVLAAVRA